MPIKFIAKMIEKMNYPLIVLNIAAIGAAFYKQGQLDALKEIKTTSAIQHHHHRFYIIRAYNDCKLLQPALFLLLPGQ